jgi:peptide/nickel transport system substrate-binding protein
MQRPFDVGPNFTYEESLVSRVDYTRRRPFTLTYHIRPEARWSDGVSITAQDFIFTLQAIRRHAPPEFRDFHAPIRSARAVDRKTLRVVLRPRSASWRDFFGNILPSHALRGSDLTQVWSDRIDDPRTGRPIGSGPFLVERLERGRQLVLRRNPRYWGPHAAYVERLVIRFAEVATDPSDELRSGELDVATLGPPAFVPTVRQVPGVRLVSSAGANFEQLAVQLGRNAHPALHNKLVRRALAYGIDRTALVRQIWGDVDPSARALDSAVHLAQSRDYEPNWGAYRYRPAEARRLLEQAGCRRGADGVFSCGGERLSLRFVTSAGFAIRAQALSLIQAQLRAAGVEVVPVFAAPGAFFGQILPQGTFDVALFSWANSPAESWAPFFGCGGVSNYTGYCQRLITAHFNQADMILDDRRRARVLNSADRGLASDVPTIPLYQFVATAAYDTSVRGFRFLPWNPLWNAENWWLAE